ncbi:hypothetical protein E2C01_072364 [Portunus trituberculatus]|uniref:Uncharacterized protein n=1 Tax=Portunus trituberculatus TaxID=210409 RepID=A0A5B7I6X3_PORTR|nr:hypothetical protein [Portunus trituberculatus]
MSWSPSIAGHSPDGERPTGMYRFPSNVKDLHKGSRHAVEFGQGVTFPPREEQLFSVTSLSPASTDEDNSAPNLALIMDAIAVLRSDMDKLKKESKAVSPARFSGFRSPRQRPAVQRRWSRGMFPVLRQGAKNYRPTENVSEELDKEVTAVVNHPFVSGMQEEDYKAIVEEDVTLRPSNCHA